jgi:putative ABC transport system permease protein
VMKIAFAVIPEVPYGLHADPATFVFAALFAVGTTIAFGLAPALHATRADIGQVIKNSGTHAIRRSRLQGTFVVIQLACSQPVLVVTSLVLADLRRGQNDNADKAPASVVTMRSELLRPAPAASAPLESRDSAATAARVTLGLVRRRLEEIPGVQSASIYTRGRGERFEVPGGGQGTKEIRQIEVTAGYFASHGIPLVRGRAIAVDDDRRGSVAVVVNEETAKLLWPGADPIGKRLVRRPRNDDGEPTTLEVIGVAGTAPYAAYQRTPEVFAPMWTAMSVWQTTYAVRTSGDARPFLPRIRAAIREVEPYATVNEVSTLAERYAVDRRFAVESNLAAFGVGAAALLLASLGLYAIIAFAVAQRTREIGIRLAIGATSGAVVRHFFRNGLKVTAIGLAIGLPVTVVGIRLVQANVLGFTVQNVAAVMVVVPVLVIVAALASWLPARRAGRVDPLIALRSE